MADNVVNYESKMNNALSEAIADWWKSLTKEELLDYLREQPAITADVLRALIANNDSVLAFDIRFATAPMVAVTDFHTK